MPHKTADSKSTPNLLMPKTYNPSKHEGRIYKMWEQKDYFKGVIDKTKEPFCVAMPPPNATGSLHLGHVIPETIEDIMIRFERMRGKAVLFLPGTDHAAIATQTLVEKQIAEREGKTRHDLGRKEFLKRVHAFIKDSQKNIRGQIRRIGVSCDWSRERYTMDPDMSRAVREAFVRLYNEGLIYRGKRIISWCPRCASGLSDIEVKYKEEPGSLWYVKYPVIKKEATGEESWDLEEAITVATTRPETMLGDTAVAVNPSDARYKKLIGKKVILPIAERPIPVIADKHVDKNFGTGALKITPAHDFDDFEIGQRHRLAVINIIDEQGRLNEHAHDFAGQATSSAREAIVKRLQKLGFLDRIEPGKHKVPLCDRCDAKIEPLISDQWFVKVAPLAKKSVAAIKSGRIEFIPRRFEKVFFQWMENIHDWNISRQLWWGHRIPVWTCNKCAREIVAIDPVKKCPKCAHAHLRQDPDTLDTWFSSGLWTFATLGWPKKNAALDFWHPTSVMETGRDLIFFWVARMIMLSLFLQKEVPFKKVYFNGLMLDRHGKKMSKSKGNGIDPMLMADRYGMDAVRMSVVVGVAAGQDGRMYPEKIANYRNFANKLWNISRFVIATAGAPQKNGALADLAMDDLSLAERWILNDLGQLIIKVTGDMEKYRFAAAGQAIFHFVWDDFADWYLEIAKITNTPRQNTVLLIVLTEILKLLHPFMPFITESIWQRLKTPRDKDLIVAVWPGNSTVLLNKKAAADFERVREFIVAARNIRADFKIAPDVKFAVGTTFKKLQQEFRTVEGLANIKINKQLSGPGSVTRPFGADKITAQIGDYINVAKELLRVAKDLAQTNKILKGLSARLANKEFLNKAPAKVVAEEKKRLTELAKKIKNMEKIEQELRRLNQ